jgi:hypothetical protein
MYINFLKPYFKLKICLKVEESLKSLKNESMLHEFDSSTRFDYLLNLKAFKIDESKLNTKEFLGENFK